jgi:hypothetical protein
VAQKLNTLLQLQMLQDITSVDQVDGSFHRTMNNLGERTFCAVPVEYLIRVMSCLAAVTRPLLPMRPMSSNVSVSKLSKSNHHGNIDRFECRLPNGVLEDLHGNLGGVPKSSLPRSRFVLGTAASL